MAKLLNGIKNLFKRQNNHNQKDNLKKPPGRKIPKPKNISSSVLVALRKIEDSKKKK